MNSGFHYHLIIITLLTLISVNLFIIDLKLFSPGSTLLTSSEVSTGSPAVTMVQTATDTNTCPAACISLIKTTTPSSSISSTNLQPATNNSPPIIRESFIPLGTGSTSKSDWDDLISTETIINPANYGNIKEAYFIASLKNTTQNGTTQVQLINATDKHPVWGSDVVMNGPAAQTITSNKIILDNGAKLYRVQLKSSLGFNVSLENARIKIISE